MTTFTVTPDPDLPNERVYTRTTPDGRTVGVMRVEDQAPAYCVVLDLLIFTADGDTCITGQPVGTYATLGEALVAAEYDPDPR